VATIISKLHRIRPSGSAMQDMGGIRAVLPTRAVTRSRAASDELAGQLSPDATMSASRKKRVRPIHLVVMQDERRIAINSGRRGRNMWRVGPRRTRLALGLGLKLARTGRPERVFTVRAEAWRSRGG